MTPENLGTEVPAEPVHETTSDVEGVKPIVVARDLAGLALVEITVTDTVLVQGKVAGVVPNCYSLMKTNGFV